MPASRIEPDLYPDDLEKTDESDVESQNPDKNRRRLSDSIDSRGRKLKLDRRANPKDRRTGTASEYKSPARRKTIDRRESPNDRRNKD